MAGECASTEHDGACAQAACCKDAAAAKEERAVFQTAMEGCFEEGGSDEFGNIAGEEQSEDVSEEPSGAEEDPEQEEDAELVSSGDA